MLLRYRLVTHIISLPLLKKMFNPFSLPIPKIEPPPPTVISRMENDIVNSLLKLTVQVNLRRFFIIRSECYPIVFSQQRKGDNLV